MVVAMAVQLLKNYTAPYFDQVSYHPRSLSSKSLIILVPHRPDHVPPLSTDLGFSFLVLHLLGGFSLIDPLSGFLPQSFHQWVRRFFISGIIL